MPRSVVFFVLVLSTLSISASSHGTEEHAHQSEHEPINLRSRSLIFVKIECLILIFVLTFISGVSPYFFKWNEGFLVSGTQFAGGVFLGTALMHFLSDANETFGDLTSKEYPFAFMLACVGYLLTMLADCVVTHVYGNQQSGFNYDLELQGAVEPGKVNQNDTSGASIQVSNSTNRTTSHFSANKASSYGDSVLLIIALCFHSVFEGIAIGVSETKADAWRALWTITLHKIFAAVAMGIALLRMIPNRPFLSCLAYSFAFAISSPIGTATGIVIDATAQGPVADWIFAVSMGLACGVFVYVSVNHLLAKGYSPDKRVWGNTPFYKFLAALLGIGVIAVVMIWDT